MAYMEAAKAASGYNSAHARHEVSYTKPVIVAQNGAAGVFAAGCPAKDCGGTVYPSKCKNCERTA